MFSQYLQEVFIFNNCKCEEQNSFSVFGTLFVWRHFQRVYPLQLAALQFILWGVQIRAETRIYPHSRSPSSQKEGGGKCGKFKKHHFELSSTQNFLENQKKSWFRGKTRKFKEKASNFWTCKYPTNKRGGLQTVQKHFSWSSIDEVVDYHF